MATSRPTSGRPGRLAARVGQFKTPFGYESLRSSSDLRFAERALPTALSPRRDLGAMVRVGVGRRAWKPRRGSSTASPMAPAAPTAGARGPDGAARVFGPPWRTAGGASASGVAVAAGTERVTRERPGLAEYETPGDRDLLRVRLGVRADGTRLRLAPQATLDLGRLHVLGEWTWVRHRVREDARGPVTA